MIAGTDAHLLRSNSILRHGKSSSLKTGLQLVAGKMLSAFGKRSSRYRLTHQTITVTIGIIGSAVYAESYPEYSYLCTCYGQVELSTNVDPTVNERIKTSYHENPRYIYNSPVDRKLIVEAPVINHKDSELILLESLQGRMPPFEGGGY